MGNPPLTGNHRHNPAYSNWYALESWVKEYGVLNGTALTDAITTDCFLKDFQLTYATLFSGTNWQPLSKKLSSTLR